jgi:hypothetical protein
MEKLIQNNKQDSVLAKKAGIEGFFEKHLIFNSYNLFQKVVWDKRFKSRMQKIINRFVLTKDIGAKYKYVGLRPNGHAHVFEISLIEKDKFRIIAHDNETYANPPLYHYINFIVRVTEEGLEINIKGYYDSYKTSPYGERELSMVFEDLETIEEDKSSYDKTFTRTSIIKNSTTIKNTKFSISNIGEKDGKSLKYNEIKQLTKKGMLTFRLNQLRLYFLEKTKTVFIKK